MRLLRLALAIEPEDLRPSARRAAQCEQQPDGGRLSGAVGPEEADHLARVDLEIEMVKGHDVAEALREAFSA